MFNDEDYLESRMFPPLHKIVLNLSSVKLRQQLELSTSSINDKDVDGRTALSWAAARGDAESVKVLLHFGADVNICSLRGQSPLHWATQNPVKNSFETVKLLVNSGADINCVDYWKRTALIYAAAQQNGSDCLQLLISRGANLDAQDCHERTPVGHAARMGKSKTLQYLLACGADPNLADDWGITPLLEAVQQNHHKVLQVLLQDDRVLPFKDVGKMPTLHAAALHGDLETLRLLAAHNTEVPYTIEYTDNSPTPQDLLAQREDKDAQLEEAFQTLIERATNVKACESVILASSGTVDENDEADLADDFADAVEYQE